MTFFNYNWRWQVGTEPFRWFPCFLFSCRVSSSETMCFACVCITHNNIIIYYFSYFAVQYVLFLCKQDAAPWQRRPELSGCLFWHGEVWVFLFNQSHAIRDSVVDGWVLYLHRLRKCLWIPLHFSVTNAVLLFPFRLCHFTSLTFFPLSFM